MSRSTVPHRGIPDGPQRVEERLIRRSGRGCKRLRRGEKPLRGEYGHEPADSRNPGNLSATGVRFLRYTWH